VLTGIAIAWRGAIASHVERTAVAMAPLSEADIAWYVASGEPLDKAGAYAIQGLASRFIPRIDGSYANVVGLPVTAVLGLASGLTGAQELAGPRGGHRRTSEDLV
jgi:septum formation protein